MFPWDFRLSERGLGVGSSQVGVGRGHQQDPQQDNVQAQNGVCKCLHVVHRRYAPSTHFLRTWHGPSLYSYGHHGLFLDWKLGFLRTHDLIDNLELVQIVRQLNPWLDGVLKCVFDHPPFVRHSFGPLQAKFSNRCEVRKVRRGCPFFDRFRTCVPISSGISRYLKISPCTGPRFLAQPSVGTRLVLGNCRPFTLFARS
ncbi:hypothetical protein BD410DRAFT_293797 [Rickenella mellea]|uniref:Uncharacterized protein n=1 Tax=Rickenella mellea TaxID=50990 RepID=A0A4Y7Q3X3_9AGAM|nr:hypothetical protein BD410DRAFT_293797 [Rickenella mellea]